jgi:hypothetical protein
MGTNMLKQPAPQQKRLTFQNGEINGGNANQLMRRKIFK